MRSSWLRTIQRAYVLALVLVVLLIVGTSQVRYARSRAAEAAARDRAVAIAARCYAEMHGSPPPIHEKLPDDQAFHVKVRREDARGGYLVGFGRQYIASKERDASGRPIPGVSGPTTFDYFRVKDDGSCEYSNSVSWGSI